MRLWLDRHYRRRAGRRRLVLALSALLAMALGAGVTLAFTQPGPGTARQVRATASVQWIARTDAEASWGRVAGSG